ncbi:DegV family protein [Acaricomes phytoseiuli]|uniref:DegV family protein n=1 Tax=Acaricomes phytoseiuli TaxID=291968 RepID=UPI00035E56D4|nr:DegV family protein [Acaricomes phytoseiuli]MCW1249162.1 DegV family protein [Acaricomes phytoseiuli]
MIVPAGQHPAKPLPFWRRRGSAAVAAEPAGASPAAPPAVAVVTDSAAAFPLQQPGDDLVEGRLSIVPMPVIVSGEVYQEGDPELSGLLSVALAAGWPVSTSRPSPGQFEKTYQDLIALGYRNIVSLHLSAELSGTVEAARLAASRFPDIRIDVVDSRTVALALGLGVRAAVAAARQQGSAEQVLLAARSVWDSSEMFFSVPSLEQLRRGGRIGAAASWLGTMLAIKPILGIAEGKVVPLERVRSSARAEAKLEELIGESFARNSEEQILGIQYFGNPEQAQQLLERMRARVPAATETLLIQLPAVLAAHAGMGVLAGVVATPAQAL